MATKDDRPGLLSKVAKFVRNPTKDWSELDQLETPQATGYDKKALQAMIERKRQNDFVRRREFDQLRKLRNRDPAAMASMSRPSFFQNSLPGESEDRSETLKKIDEIEAQMSRQWWKNKETERAALEAGNTNVMTQSGITTEPMDSLASREGPASVPTTPFAATEVMSMTHPASSGSTDFASTQMASNSADLSQSWDLSASMGVHRARPSASSSPEFSTSRLFALDSESVETDPELEEAAIRFANGDDQGAEAGLVLALRADLAQTESGTLWLAALLDLYRATNQSMQFELALQEFGQRLGGKLPLWEALSDKSPAAAEGVIGAKGSGSQAALAHWHCPATLDAAAMEALRDVLSTQAAPWRLDWAALQDLTPEALPLIQGLFDSLCAEPVAVQFIGADHLGHCLRTITSQGERREVKAWWDARLAVLRAMHFQDEFELAALDYCVTFGVVPPDWVDPRCQFESLGGAAAAAAPSDWFTVDLHGEVLGDATPILSQIDPTAAAGQRIVVSCASLLRVDFSAAGSILNWVTVRENEGCQVEFHDVHRLVGAFFNVIGIHEHARVQLRT